MEILYPEGKRGTVTFSYDDGQVNDRRLAGLFDRYGLRATFHLNSGNLDRDGYVTSREVPSLYRSHEIACHGIHHPYLTHLSAEQIVREIYGDRAALEQLAGYPVRGLSYPFGEYSAEVIRALKALGIEYSRTVREHGGFRIPEDFMAWDPTCHHGGNVLEKADKFLNPPGYLKLPLFYIWGHSFEFRTEDDWAMMEAFCKKISGSGTVWYATNLQIKRYLCAVRSLVWSTDETMVYNPSAVSVWMEENCRQLELKDGQTLTFSA